MRAALDASSPALFSRALVAFLLPASRGEGGRRPDEGRFSHNASNSPSPVVADLQLRQRADDLHRFQTYGDDAEKQFQRIIRVAHGLDGPVVGPVDLNSPQKCR